MSDKLSETFVVRLSEEQRDHLERLAKREGRSAANLLRRWIDLGTNRIAPTGAHRELADLAQGEPSNTPAEAER